MRGTLVVLCLALTAASAASPHSTTTEKEQHTPAILLRNRVISTHNSGVVGRRELLVDAVDGAAAYGGGTFLVAVLPSSVGIAAVRLSELNVQVLNYVPTSAFLVHIHTSAVYAVVANASWVTHVEPFLADDKAQSTSIRRRLSRTPGSLTDSVAALPILVTTACGILAAGGGCTSACVVMRSMLLPPLLDGVSLHVNTAHAVPLACDTSAAFLIDPPALSHPTALRVTLHPVSNTSFALNAECGAATASTPCAVPAAFVRRLAHHPLVIWLDPIVPATHRNAHARGAVQSLDAQDWDAAKAEYGTCGPIAGSCMADSTWDFMNVPSGSLTCTPSCAVSVREAEAAIAT